MIHSPSWVGRSRAKGEAMIFWIAFLRELLKRRHRGTRASSAGT